MKTTTIIGIIVIIAAIGIGSVVTMIPSVHANGTQHFNFQSGNWNVKYVVTPSGILNAHEHCSK